MTKKRVYWWWEYDSWDVFYTNDRQRPSSTECSGPFETYAKAKSDLIGVLKFAARDARQSLESVKSMRKRDCKELAE